MSGTGFTLINTLDMNAFSAFADTSDSDTAWTVKLYDKSPGSGYDGTDRTLLNASGDLTPSNMKFSWYGPSGDVHAVIGGTATNGVTVILKGCKY